mgnify:CR=1 FL=1
MSKRIIGLAGVAGSGKDTFFELLSKEVNCQRYSLADELKREASAWTEDSYGINASTCSRLEKEIIRPFLVFHGQMRRTQTEGRYWIDKLSKEISDENHPELVLQVITDIRFGEYEKDEIHWLKKELGGTLVHVSMYNQDEERNITWKPPANECEEKNDPILKDHSDWFVEWPELSPFNPKDLREHATDFLDFILKE